MPKVGPYSEMQFQSKFYKKIAHILVSLANETGGASFTRNSPEEHGADKTNEGKPIEN